MSKNEVKELLKNVDMLYHDYFSLKKLRKLVVEEVYSTGQFLRISKGK